MSESATLAVKLARVVAYAPSQMSKQLQITLRMPLFYLEIAGAKDKQLAKCIAIA